MLRETGRLARAAGWGSLGLAAIDGTKVRANTSRHKAMSHGRRVAEGPETQRIHRLVRLPWARARYARRKTQAERPHAEIACAAFNLRRPRAFAIAARLTHAGEAAARGAE